MNKNIEITEERWEELVKLAEYNKPLEKLLVMIATDDVNLGGAEE